MRLRVRRTRSRLETEKTAPPLFHNDGGEFLRVDSGTRSHSESRSIPVFSVDYIWNMAGLRCNNCSPCLHHSSLKQARAIRRDWPTRNLDPRPRRHCDVSMGGNSGNIDTAGAQTKT